MANGKLIFQQTIHDEKQLKQHHKNIQKQRIQTTFRQKANGFHHKTIWKVPGVQRKQILRWENS